MDETFGDGKPIRASIPTAPGKGKARREEGGRVCAHPGCGTVLSTYNSSPTCWIHQADAIVRSERTNRRGLPTHPERTVFPAA
jgi:hypothetical protein